MVENPGGIKDALVRIPMSQCLYEGHWGLNHAHEAKNTWCVKVSDDMNNSTLYYIEDIVIDDYIT